MDNPRSRVHLKKLVCDITAGRSEVTLTRCKEGESGMRMVTMDGKVFRGFFAVQCDTDALARRLSVQWPLDQLDHSSYLKFPISLLHLIPI